MSEFNPLRLVEARAYCKMTGEALASKIGVKKQAISQFENKKANPEYENVQKMGEVMGFPTEFFYEGSVPILEGNTYFRALFSSNKRDLSAQKIKTKYVALIYEALTNYVDFCPYNVPEFPEGVGIEEAAKALRDYWNLGQEPIPDMITLMERNGIILSEFSTESSKIDAFSQYGEIRNIPYRCVVIGTEKNSFVRRQFSLAHELGHIILHEKFEDLSSMDREEFRQRESEANDFAANFLLPREAFLEDLLIQPNRLSRYIDLKRKWRVSISCMVRRAYSLDAINANQYQYMMRQIAQSGWKTREPLDDYFVVKRPKALRQAVNLVILNKVLTGRQLLDAIKREGVSMSKQVVDEVLGLEPETIVVDETVNNKVIPFARLKR